jgi:Mg-chelatase subunit ChlD
MTPVASSGEGRVMGRLRALRNANAHAYEGLMAALPEVGEGLAGGDRLADLLDLLNQILVEAPDCAELLIGRLAALPASVDLPTLRKWVIHGLQLHARSPAEALHHFEGEDPHEYAREATDDNDAQWQHRQATLTHYLAGFGHPEIEVEAHRRTPGHRPARRASLADGLLLLPRPFGPADGRIRSDLHRAAAAHVLAHLMFSPLRRPVANRPPMLLAMVSLLEDARVERLMARRYPGLHALWGRFHVATRQSAGFELDGLMARLAHGLHDRSYVDSNAWVGKGRQLFEEVAERSLDDIAAFDHVGRVLTRQMVKHGTPFKAGTYRVEPLYRDDNQILWSADDVLPTNDQQTVTLNNYELLNDEREDEPRGDLRQVEVDPRRRTAYPEWDFKLGELREAWATVFDETDAGRNALQRSAAGPPSTLHRTLRPRGLDRVPDRSIRLARLHEGDELDLGAAVDSRIQLRGRVAPDPRIFRRHGRRRRSVAVVLLIDLSESTNHYVPGSFTTVLELEKRAAMLVAESFDAERDRIAVHGFRSNGRREVSCVHIKDFDEPFGREQRERLLRERGRLSTRMGAALRHAGNALAAEKADQRVILLLTDGEPSDVDVLEDDYLVEDAREAVGGAASRGIRSFCLTLDRHADRYVRRIFGTRHYLIVDRADSFTTRLAQTLVRIVAH